MDSFALVIFGITSNLAQIKLIPALYDMAEKGLLPENMYIVGNARSPKSYDEFKEFFHKSLVTHHRQKENINKEVFEKLAKKIFYIDGSTDNVNFYPKLKELLNKLDPSGSECNNKIFYLATYPELYTSIFENLKNSGLNSQEKGWVRLMIEKPIGNDLLSAKQLNELLLKYFSENQIYRIDHYLGKETIQNILTFRFGNDIFEPLINKEYIDHIQITAAEDFGIGQRGGYYDKVGALKDFGQNHSLQMLAFATMESPKEFTNEAVTHERLKILQKLVPLPEKVVFGQYEGYSNEPNVDPNSKIDTFYAFKTFIDNDRFRDVPIYTRGGKRLTQTVTEISIVFKNNTNKIFGKENFGDKPNILIYRIQPNEGIVLKVLVKKPGHTTELESTYMQYCYRPDKNSPELADAYEKLISDAIRGDQTFFNDAAEIESQWAFIDPLAKSKKQVIKYPEGSWGPKEADELIKEDSKAWLEPSMLFCKI